MDETLDREARVMEWESGVSLDLAWVRFGDERQRKQQSRRAGTPSSLVIRSLMMVDIFSRIADGELVAWGYRTQPTPLDGPIAIPADVFTVRPKPGMPEDAVEASGFRYERVTIVRAGEAADGTPPMPKLSAAEPVLGTTKNTYHGANPIIREMFEEVPGRRHLSAERLIDDFNVRYFAATERAGGQGRRLSARKLRDHLKTYKMETSGNIRKP